MSKIQVLVADDHALFRQGLCGMIKPVEDIDVVGETGNGAEAVAKTQELLPDIVLMDISMPEMDGIEATRKIKESCPKTEIIILTMHEDIEYIFRAVKAGACNYICKDSPIDALVRVIKAAFRGESLLTPALGQRVLAEFADLSKQDAQRKTFSSLTPREMEILKLLSQAKADEQIASSLFISRKTVRSHISNIFRKLQVNTRMEAALKAANLGLVDLGK